MKHEQGPCFNTFISLHKIIDIAERVGEKKPLLNIEKFKSNIFLKTVSVLSVAVSIRMVLICGCTFLLTGACRS